MLSVNSKILFRTNGRGVTRTLKGIVFGIVKAGMTPKTNQLKASLPHGDKPSNRDRYIVKLDKIGTLVWANVATAVAGDEKLPTHRPRLSAKPKAKTKPIAKDTSKVAKAVKKAFRAIDKKVKATPKKLTKAERKFIVADKPIKSLDRTPVAKKSGGDKPKTTWYGVVDGKVVSVRKVVCPEGFSKVKMAVPTPTPAPAVETPAPATPAPATEAAALPQAAV